MTDELEADFLLALGRLTAASAELDGDIAFLYAVAGTRTQGEEEGVGRPVMDAEDWRKALTEGRQPAGSLRKRAELVVDGRLRKTLLDLCDRVIKAQAHRDTHVHSIGTSLGRWHPRSDSYKPLPPVHELDALTALMQGLAGEAATLASSWPANALRDGHEGLTSRQWEEIVKQVGQVTIAGSSLEECALTCLDWLYMIHTSARPSRPHLPASQTIREIDGALATSELGAAVVERGRAWAKEAMAALEERNRIVHASWSHHVTPEGPQLKGVRQRKDRAREVVPADAAELRQIAGRISQAMANGYLFIEQLEDIAAAGGPDLLRALPRGPVAD